MLTETGLTEIEIADKDSRIRVVRARGDHRGGGRAGIAAPMAAAAPPSPRRPTTASHPGAVISPMVGVAYLVAGARRAALRHRRPAV